MSADPTPRLIIKTDNNPLGCRPLTIFATTAPVQDFELGIEMDNAELRGVLLCDGVECGLVALPTLEPIPISMKYDDLEASAASPSSPTTSSFRRPLQDSNSFYSTIQALARAHQPSAGADDDSAWR